MKLSLVRGAQAEGAKLRLGLVKITKPCAKDLWDNGIPIVLVGNKVNDSHFFSGEGWALRVDTNKNRRETTFDAYVNAFKFYLEPELGNQVSFFVFNDELKRYTAKRPSPDDKFGRVQQEL